VETKLFVLCKRVIKHHGKIAFHRNHTFVAVKSGTSYKIMSELDSMEIFPRDYFNEHFIVIFPVMEDPLK
jgi:hypothetical protein